MIHLNKYIVCNGAKRTVTSSGMTNRRGDKIWKRLWPATISSNSRFYSYRLGIWWVLFERSLKKNPKISFYPLKCISGYFILHSCVVPYTWFPWRPTAFAFPALLCKLTALQPWRVIRAQMTVRPTNFNAVVLDLNHEYIFKLIKKTSLSIRSPK